MSLRRKARAALAIGCAACAVGAAAVAVAPAQQDPVEPAPPVAGLPPEPDERLVREGRALFVDGCSSCHGFDARGIPERGPSLRGVGEASADFYLRTGRMPLDDPEDQPQRSDSPYSSEQIRALVAYVGSFGGPPIPTVHPERGNLRVGFETFAENCAGCHQAVARGGITGRGIAPDLQAAKPIDVAEAIQIGPYLMPHFRGQLSQHEVDSLARYVEYTEDPEDEGGWGIGHIGPIPEGMVAWLLAGFVLVLVARLIGERVAR